MRLLLPIYYIVVYFLPGRSLCEADTVSWQAKYNWSRGNISWKCSIHIWKLLLRACYKSKAIWRKAGIIVRISIHSPHFLHCQCWLVNPGMSLHYTWDNCVSTNHQAQWTVYGASEEPFQLKISPGKVLHLRTHIVSHSIILTFKGFVGRRKNYSPSGSHTEGAKYLHLWFRFRFWRWAKHPKTQRLFQKGTHSSCWKMS